MPAIATGDLVQCNCSIWKGMSWRVIDVGESVTLASLDKPYSKLYGLPPLLGQGWIKLHSPDIP